MNLSKQALWERFQKRYFEFPSIGLSVDLSRMNFADDFFETMDPAMQRAFAAMAALEAGAIANPDENRMVGHYWLRNPALAPTAQIRGDIESTIENVKEFAGGVHEGTIRGARGPFKNVLLIGIGGSALGPQFVSHALGNPITDRVELYFFDNTDPDGMDKTLSRIITELGQTLCIVTSKSGGTKETRNGMLEAEAAYARAGLGFAQHAVAVTGVGSALDVHAKAGNWLARFPMWDWVGGRTSETSAVGLLPAALQGVDIDGLLRGAREADKITRLMEITLNPSAMMACAWHYIGNGVGSKDLVVLPYKDRLELFSKYLQQLIMESLGKEKALDGTIVHQGLSVYGNKGSTDQHAYIQQLRDGLRNFFVVFIEVLRDRNGDSVEVEPQTTSGDYLSGYYLGTRQALFENGRESVSLTIPEVSPFSVGMLIALFERAVGFYASLINVNAYHQPGVEAGKQAADAIVTMKREIVAALDAARGEPLGVEEIARRVETDDAEGVFKVCEHIAANPEWGIVRASGRSPSEVQYRKI